MLITIANVANNSPFSTFGFNYFNNNNNNLLARVIQQYNDQYKKHSNSITVPNGVVAIC